MRRLRREVGDLRRPISYFDDSIEKLLAIKIETGVNAMFWIIDGYAIIYKIDKQIHSHTKQYLKIILQNVHRLSN